MSDSNVIRQRRPTKDPPAGSRGRRGLIYAVLLIGMMVISGCHQPLNQGALSEPALEVLSQEAIPRGQVRIRVSTTGAESRNLRPGIEAFSQYVLSFTHEDGTSVPDVVLAGEEPLLVDLKTGTWRISACGFVTNDGGVSVAAARGGVEIPVEAGKEIHTLIVLDTIISGEGIPGVFSYGVEFPRDLVSSAVMELSIPGIDDQYIPYMVLDLGDPEKQKASLSLPSGYYRMHLRLGTIFPVIHKTELIQIYPAMETKTPLYRFDETEFPVVRELEGLAALEAYLAEQPDNTPKTPYLIKLTGFSLTGDESSPGNTLEALYKALVRYTALDLRDCTGESVPKLTLTDSDKENLVSLLLPETVKTIHAGAFSGFKNLVHLEAPGLSSIDMGAFNNCTSLESVYMPLVETIADTSKSDQGVFRNCSSLYSVFLPQAHFIGSYAFSNCGSLEAIFLPAGKYIGTNAFRSCKSLVSSSLPQVESLVYRAFYSCKNLLNLMLGKDPPDLGDQIFTGGRPASVYVPAAGLEAYEETAKENWTGTLKAKVRSLPE